MTENPHETCPAGVTAAGFTRQEDPMHKLVNLTPHAVVLRDAQGQDHTLRGPRGPA